MAIQSPGVGSDGKRMHQHQVPLGEKPKLHKKPISALQEWWAKSLERPTTSTFIVIRYSSKSVKLFMFLSFKEKEYQQMAGPRLEKYNQDRILPCSTLPWQPRKNLVSWMRLLHRP